MTTIPHEHTDGLGVSRMSGDARREQLIQVAMNLFSRKGFSGTTTKEIALAAGVTEALIFRHFPTKDALYDAILRWRVDQSSNQNWLASLEAIAAERDDEALIRAIAAGLLEFHRENVDFLRLMFYAVLENHQLAQSFRERQIKPIYDFLCGYVATRQAEGAFIAVDPGAAVRAIFGMPFYHSVVTNLFHCSLMQFSETDAIDTFVQIALNGLRTSAQGSELKPSLPGVAGETE